MSINEGEKELRLKNCKQNEMFGATNRKWMWHGIVVSTTGYYAGGWGSNLA
jgi:hypothetical protein